MKDTMTNIVNEMEQIQNILDSTYNRGYNKGYDNRKIEEEFEDKSKDYEKGLNDAWELARRLVYAKEDYPSAFSIKELDDIFGCHSILRHFTAQWALEKLKEYENEKKQERATDGEIKVGDEFKSNHSGRNCVLTRIQNGLVVMLWADGSTGERTVNQINANFKKTGRHFTQMDEVLKHIDEEHTSNTSDDIPSRLCMDCKYGDLSIDSDICGECFFDIKKPNFEEVKK